MSSNYDALEARKHWVKNRAATYVYVHGMPRREAILMADADYRRELPHATTRGTP